MGIHHRIHRHIKTHLKKLKKKRPHVHKAIILMSITLPVMLGALLFGSSALYYYESYFDTGSDEKERITVNLPTIEDDTLNWKTYRDDLSGFSIKYSDHWANPQISNFGSAPKRTVQDGAKYLRKILFDNGIDAANEKYNGFEIYVYDAKKFPGPVGTSNLTIKDPDIFTKENCDKVEFPEAALGEDGYPSQEVDVSPNDRCFAQAYFFSVTSGDYTYNIVPLVGETDIPIGEGLKPSVIASFPKFFEITSTLILPKIEAKAVEEKNTAKRIVEKKAPEPRRVLVHLAKCAHKNDHPHKSKTKKHRHMDEDCCMDPDEWPNPRCQY